MHPPGPVSQKGVRATSGLIQNIVYIEISRSISLIGLKVERKENANADPSPFIKQTRFTSGTVAAEGAIVLLTASRQCHKRSTKYERAKTRALYRT